MSLRSATEWPESFSTRLDPISPGPKVGLIWTSTSTSSPSPSGTSVGAEGTRFRHAAPTAGVKPTDVIVRKYNEDRQGNKIYYWLNQTTGETYYYDPRPPQPSSTTPTPQSSSTTFVRSGYIGIVFQTRSAAVAYELWVKQGSTINQEDASNAYVRRGGSFTQTSGTEWFKNYSDMRGSPDRYAPRKKGRSYRNAAQQEAYKTELANTYSHLLITQLTNEGFDWVSGTYTQTINEFGELAAWLNTNSVVSDPVNFGNGGGGGGGGRGSRGRDSGIPETPELPIPAITITTRMPRGYVGRGLSIGSRPQMVQRYQFETKNDKGEPVTKHADDIYLFRYIPQGVKYSGLSGQWVEVPRAEDIPFVDWASWQLMKVSFSFIVADDRTEAGGAIVPDGLEISVDGQIEKLRRMAQRKVPVTLVNFDEMLTFQLRRGNTSKTGDGPQPNMEFVITDFSVTATRRTAVPNTGAPSTPSLIAVAQCEITLTEIPVETVGIIALPPITTPALPPSSKSPPGATNGQEYDLISKITVRPDRAFNGYLPQDDGL